MPYIKRIVCLANSFKKGGSCIAGREVLGNRYGGWIRPVSGRPTAEVWFSESRYADSTNPKLLDVIEVAFLKLDPRKHQTENHIIDISRRWKKVGELKWAALAQLCERPASLWMNSDKTKGPGCYDCISEAEAATLRNSLTLIKPDNFTVDAGPHHYTHNRTYRGRLDYNGTHYNMSVTDPVVTNKYATKEDGSYPLKGVYACISLTEPYEKDNRCHKLVAAVLGNPPL